MQMEHTFNLSVIDKITSHHRSPDKSILFIKWSDISSVLGEKKQHNVLIRHKMETADLFSLHA